MNLDKVLDGIICNDRRVSLLGASENPHWLEDDGISDVKVETRGTTVVVESKFSGTWDYGHTFTEAYAAIPLIVVLEELARKIPTVESS